VQAALFPFDASYQRAHLVGHEMVHLDRDPAATGLIHERRGLFDRLQPVHLRPLGPARSSGDVDSRSGRTQLHGDPSSRSPGRSGDHGNLACQRCLHAAEPNKLRGGLLDPEMPIPGNGAVAASNDLVDLYRT